MPLPKGYGAAEASNLAIHAGSRIGDYDGFVCFPPFRSTLSLYRPRSLPGDHRAEPFILQHIRDEEIAACLAPRPIIVMEAGRLIPCKRIRRKLKDDISFCLALRVEFGYRERLGGRGGRRARGKRLTAHCDQGELRRSDTEGSIV